MTHRPLSPEELVLQLDRLRSVARRIESDPHCADDLAQETLLVALARPPSLRGEPFAWLSAVLRRRKLFRDRSDERRRRREQAYSQNRLASDGDGDTRRAERIEGVVRVLFQVEEPYRSALVERFLEGRTPHEIAERHGVPVRTVHTRVTRGLRRLRDRLDPPSREEARRPPTWIAYWSRRSPRFATRAASLVLAAGTALLVIGGAFVEPAEPPAHERAGVSAPLPASDGAEDVASAGAAVRAVMPHAAAVEELEGSPPRPVERPNGHVVDQRGAGVGGVEVRFEPGRMTSAPGRAPSFLPSSGARRSVTAADGSFRIERRAGETGRLSAFDAEFAAVTTEWVSFEQSSPYRLTVARRRPLAGFVSDADGSPIARARLRLLPPPAVAAGQSRPEATWATVELESTSDDEGCFRFEDAFDLAGVEIHAQATGYAATTIRLDGSVNDVRIGLTRLAGEDDVALRGRVVTPDLEPVEGAVVACGETWATTDERGEYRLIVPNDPPPGRVTAVAKGFGPATAPSAPGSDALLVLSDRVRSLAGRVVAAAGRPVAGAFVLIADPTPFLRTERVSWFTESLASAAGDAVPATTTDGEGRFVLRGLLARSYRVRAFDGASLAAADAVADPFDAEIVLHLPPRSADARLLGRVVDCHGRPIAGADVRPRREALHVAFPSGPPARSFVTAAPVATAADGSFEFAALAQTGCELLVSGSGVYPVEWSVERAAGFVEIRVARRAVVRVEIAEIPTDQDAYLVVLDARREVVTLHDQFVGADPATHARRVRSVALSPRSERRLAVPDDACEVVVCTRSEVLARRVVTIDAARRNDLLIQAQGRRWSIDDRSRDPRFAPPVPPVVLDAR